MKSIYTLGGVLACTLVFAVPAFAAKAVTGWLWSDNVGWTEIRPGTTVVDDAAGLPSRAISGWGWSDNVGWLKFDAGVPSWATGDNNISTAIKGNQLVGWARYCAGTVSGDCNSASRTDGWDGWLKFTNATYESTSGNMGGYAWGSDVVGWNMVDMNTVPEDDDDNDSDCNANPSDPDCVQIVCNLSGGTTATPTWNATCKNRETGEPIACNPGMRFEWTNSGSDTDSPSNDEMYSRTLTSGSSYRAELVRGYIGSNDFTRVTTCSEARYNSSTPSTYDVDLLMAPETGTGIFGIQSPVLITVKKGKRANAQYEVNGTGIDEDACYLTKNAGIVPGYVAGNPSQIVTDVSNWEIGTHDARVRCPKILGGPEALSNIVQVKVINNPVYTEF